MKRRLMATLVALLSIGLLAAPGAADRAEAVPAAPPSITVSPTTVNDNGTVSVAVDFPTSTYDGLLYGNYPWLNLFKSTDGGATWVSAMGPVKSTSAGTYTFNYNVGTATQKIRVGYDGKTLSGQSGAFYNDPSKSLYTAAMDIDPVTPPPPPPPGTNTLSVQADGKKATAQFGTPHSGQSASLQIEVLVTKNTPEVNTASWKTIASATQNSSGVATFSIANPYEVKHKYRVISGSDITDIVSLAATQGAKVTGIPQVYLNTNEQATIDTRTRYFEGTFELKNASNPKFTCTMKKADGTDRPQPQLASAKGRGNFSWSFAKKSYTVKLDSRTNVCGMGTSSKWALVANHYDKSLLRNTVANELGRRFGTTNLGWTPKSKPVDLWMNGSYRGSYMLIERIDIDPIRVDIAESDDYRTVTDPADIGYILEWDFRKGADNNVTAGSRGYVGIKEPERDIDDKTGVDTHQGITSGQVSYINGYLDDADAALFGSGFTGSNGWRKYIDEASAVDYYLAMEIMKPIDGNMWASVFMYKEANGKLKFGPLWDFDMSSGSALRAGNAISPSGWYLRNVLSNFSARQSTKTWFNRLNEDSGFRSKVAARWNALYDNLSMTDFINQQKSILSASAAENWKVWSHSQQLSASQVIKSSWSADVDYLRGWMSARRSWLNGQY